jgi:hypothetical protein
MYSQHYPVLDNVVYAPQQQAPLPQHLQQQLYHPQHQQAQHRLQPPLHPTIIQQQLQQQQQQQLHQQQAKKEPLPSATDAKPNITLTIPEIAEFSSTMVYLMWHARRQSVMDLHSSSKNEDNITHNGNSLEQTRVTADMANMTSAAFKKFCRQVISISDMRNRIALLICNIK